MRWLFQQISNLILYSVQPRLVSQLKFTCMSVHFSDILLFRFFPHNLMCNLSFLQSLFVFTFRLTACVWLRNSCHWRLTLFLGSYNYEPFSALSVHALNEVLMIRVSNSCIKLELLSYQFLKISIVWDSNFVFLLTFTSFCFPHNRFLVTMAWRVFRFGRNVIPVLRYSYVTLFLCYAISVLSYSYITLFLCYAIPVLRYSCVTLFLCYAIPMLRYSYVTLFLCYAISVLRYSYVTLFLCYAIPMFRYPYVTLFLCYAIPMLRYSYVTLFLCYAIPMLRYSYVPLFLCYAISVLRYSYVTLYVSVKTGSMWNPYWVSNTETFSIVHFKLTHRADRDGF
jgi:hypothetical protein